MSVLGFVAKETRVLRRPYSQDITESINEEIMTKNYIHLGV
jgi:hypothetical protein